MLQNCFRMCFVDSTTHPIIKWKALNSQNPRDSCNRQQVRCHKTHDSSPWGAFGKQWVHWLVTIVKNRQAKHVQFFRSWMEMKRYFHETASIRFLFFCCLHSPWDEDMARLQTHTFFTSWLWTQDLHTSNRRVQLAGWRLLIQANVI